MTNQFPQELREVIIGCTLGDLSVVKTKPSWNPYLMFEQSAAHWEYLLYLYTFFESYCNNAPKLFSIHLNSIGKDYTKGRFQTRSLPTCLPRLRRQVFKEFYDLFYLEGTKIVPANIGEFLTARSLAFWAKNEWVPPFYRLWFLFLHSFSKDEVLLLCSPIPLPRRCRVAGRFTRKVWFSFFYSSWAW